MNSVSDFIQDVIYERKNLAIKYRIPEKPLPGRMMWSDRWEVFSPLLSKDLTLYGPLECRNWILIESDQNVAGFCPQPLWMTGTYQGVDGKSLVDFYILKTDGSEEFQEVKKKEDMDNINSDPELRRQIDIQKQWCLKRNVTHVIRTEEDIDVKPFLIENWGTIIHQYSLTRNMDYTSKMAKISAALLLDKEGSIRDVTSECGEDSEFVMAHLLHLKLAELLEENQRMTWSSRVRLTQKWQ
ncbi:hypothetical protein GEOBRER4_n2069 [Citrifermentans bremense]|uniref:Uncharacterized protein n=1 Tax=Citrifermentans bremense TaxID=60035 RepID=A0A6S6M0B4_9BACT|nr:TnsA endonuclease N-terminal domain-containing protein [Citrifermentans bremense]BCG47243.1 hypothetical protein GEOBRER4_n2069 [Citrifermentans bremense]